jgi:hypothetical protein
MGFLDHSTNNLIVDAVLTDLGRQALANGTFDISQFSLGDDEVDYTIIQKFGRTVGKEKVIKNTPVYEAQTTATLAVKHRLLTLADPTVIYLPTVAVTGDVSGNTVELNSSGTTRRGATVTITQDITGVTSPASKIPIDDVFYVEVPNRFLRLEDASSATIGITDSRIEKGTQTALYTVSRTSTTSKGLPVLTLNLRTQGLDDTVFNTFGTTSSKNRIDCVFSVTGRSTGLRTTINVIINK